MGKATKPSWQRSPTFSPARQALSKRAGSPIFDKWRSARHYICKGVVLVGVLGVIGDGRRWSRAVKEAFATWRTMRQAHGNIVGLSHVSQACGARVAELKREGGREQDGMSPIPIRTRPSAANRRYWLDSARPDNAHNFGICHPIGKVGAVLTAKQPFVKTSKFPKPNRATNTTHYMAQY